MIVERGHVIRLHYELTDPSGTRLGSTREGEPHAILFGHGGVLPGIERALAGRAAGDRFEIEGEFGILVERAAAVTGPFGRSFFLLVHISRLPGSGFELNSGCGWQ